MFAELLAEQPYLAQVVAVAEPREEYREQFAAKHKLSSGKVYESWQAFVANPAECDAVVIATMDQDHVDPAGSRSGTAQAGPGAARPFSKDQRKGVLP